LLAQASTLSLRIPASFVQFCFCIHFHFHILFPIADSHISTTTFTLLFSYCSFPYPVLPSTSHTSISHFHLPLALPTSNTTSSHFKSYCHFHFTPLPHFSRSVCGSAPEILVKCSQKYKWTRAVSAKILESWQRLVKKRSGNF
jgi:hypothetical protein